MQQISVTIGPDGSVQLHVEGIAGMGCADLTAPLIAALGGQVEEQVWTLEAYQAAEDAAWATLAMEREREGGAYGR